MTAVTKARLIVAQDEQIMDCQELQGQASSLEGPARCIALHLLFFHPQEPYAEHISWVKPYGEAQEWSAQRCHWCLSSEVSDSSVAAHAGPLPDLDRITRQPDHL